MEIIDRITGELIEATEGVKIFFDAAGNPISTVTYRKLIDPGTFREPGGEQVDGLWILNRTIDGNWPDESVPFEPEFFPASENKEFSTNREALEAMMDAPLYEDENIRIIPTKSWRNMGLLCLYYLVRVSLGVK